MVVEIHRVIQQRHSGHLPHGRRECANGLFAAALTEIRHAFYKLVHDALSPLPDDRFRPSCDAV
jgi:hypothetical protein